jgi:hypothetical protein
MERKIMTNWSSESIRPFAKSLFFGLYEKSIYKLNWYVKSQVV